MFVHLLIRGGHEFADRSWGLGVVSGYSNTERQLVAELLSIHFFQMLLHSRQDHLRMGNACFPRQDGKLVSTKSRENVGIAECFVQGIGRADQRQVSLAVSEGIVDRLEIVDIEIEEQNALFITTREFQLLRNGSQKTTTIKETGEIVGNGQ